MVASTLHELFPFSLWAGAVPVARAKIKLWGDLLGGAVPFLWLYYRAAC